MMTKERKEIFVDKEGFNKAQAQFNHKKQLEFDIRKLVKELTKLVPSKEFYKNIPMNFYKLVERAYKGANPMSLSGDKLCMLMDIPTAELFDLDRQYQAVRTAAEPSLVSYTIYAESEDELAKYDACMKVIEACGELDKHIKVFPFNIQQATKNAIQFNLSKNKLVVNHNWIKGTRF